MQITIAEQLESVKKKITLVSANLANAANQLKNGKIVSPGVIDDIYNELTRLNAEKRQLEIDIAGKDGGVILPLPAVSVDALASLLGMTERNVQLQVENNLLARTERGQYDMLASYVLLWKAFKELQGGKNDEYNHERTSAMRLKRLEREREHEEAMKRLVNYDALLAARERKNADIKQKLLFLEKTLPPRLGGLSANEQEPIIKNAIRKLLTEFAVAPVPGVGHRGSGQDIPAAPGPDRKPVVGRKKKTRKQNKR